MQESFRAFAHELIDYAGLYPPAALPLEEAVRNYLGYLRGEHAWMLGRFVCSTDRLPDLAAVEEGQPVLRVCAPGRTAADIDTFLRRFQEDLEAIAVAHARERGPARVETLESRAPEELLASANPWLWRDVLTRLEGFMQGSKTPDLGLYLEGMFPAGWRTSLGVAIRAMGSQPGRRAGFKLRCGGTVAAAFPSSEQVAFVLAECRSAGISLKVTAGLHHPVRSFRAEVDTRMHGFLNVFGAALLDYEHDLSEETIRRILEDEDPGDFLFTPDGFAWRDLALSTAMIGALRRRAVTSFGSCSFDEPREDLRALGIETRNL